MTLPDADVKDFGILLREKGYCVFLKAGSMYAFKGMAGRFAPIGVHASMLLIMAGEAPPTLRCVRNFEDHLFYDCRREDCPNSTQVACIPSRDYKVSKSTLVGGLAHGRLG